MFLSSHGLRWCGQVTPVRGDVRVTLPDYRRRSFPAGVPSVARAAGDTVTFGRRRILEVLHEGVVDA